MSVTDDFGLPDDGPAGVPATPTPQPTQPSGSGLRKQLEDALAANKAMQDRMGALEAERRTTQLAGLMRAEGLPDAAAARYPADAEVNPEKVKEWATAEKAYAQQLAGVQPAGAAAPAAPVGIPPEQQRAAQLVDQAQATAAPTETGLEAQLARLRDPSVPWPVLQQELAAMGFRAP